MTPRSRDHMPTTSLWGVAAKWPTRAPKMKLILYHTHTQFTEESKVATTLTPQTDITSGKSHVTDGEPETVVLASLQKIKLIKNPIKH